MNYLKPGRDYDCLSKVYIYSLRDFKHKNRYETYDMILKVCYGFDLDSIYDEVGLIDRLIAVYYSHNHIEKVIAVYVEEQLSKRLNNVEWEALLGSKKTFFEFLQREWERFVRGSEASATCINFYAPEIRKYFLNLFKEGLLQSVPIGQAYTQANLMIKEGTSAYAQEGLEEKIEILQRNIENILGNDLNYKSIIDLGMYNGNLQHLMSITPENDDYLIEKCSGLNKLKKNIDNALSKWVMTNYDLVHSLSYAKEPIVVHKILDYIDNYKVRQQDKKIVLLVMDGMSLEDYYMLKGYMNSKKIEIEENGCFAMLPTLTSISRQAIFSGLMPMYFEESIFTTAKEEKLFKSFWIQKGYSDKRIAYVGNVKCFEEIPMEQIKDKDIVGIVVKTIDEMMHKVTFGKKQMYENLKFWLEQKTNITEFVDKVIEMGYEIILTADHGNTEAKGVGSSKRKSIAVTSSGQRAIILEQFHDTPISNTVDFKTYSLPSKYKYKLFEDNCAAVKKNTIVVTHGGASLEELIVPFIHIKEKV